MRIRGIKLETAIVMTAYFLVGSSAFAQTTTLAPNNRAFNKAIKAIETFRQYPRNSTWQAAQSAVEETTADKAQARQALAKVLYEKALEAISQYNRNPKAAAQAVELLRSYNDIQVRATMARGLYDDVVLRLIQAAEKRQTDLSKTNASTIDPLSQLERPHDVPDTFGEKKIVKDDSMMIFSETRFYIYQLDSTLKKWVQQKNIIQQNQSGRVETLDYVDLKFLIESSSGYKGLVWSLDQGGLEQTITLTVNGKFYIIDNQVSVKQGHDERIWKVRTPFNFTKGVVTSVAVDGDYMVIGERDSVDGTYRLHMYAFDHSSKQWKENKIIETKKKGPEISLAIDEDSYAAVSQRVTVLYSLLEPSGVIYAMTGSVNSSDQTIIWYGPDLIALVIPYVEKFSNVQIHLNNKTLSINALNTVLMYHLDIPSNRWVWDYNFSQELKS